MIALAQIHSYSCVVLTDERATNSENRPNIPDVCRALNIECMTLSQLFGREGWVFDYVSQPKLGVAP